MAAMAFNEPTYTTGVRLRPATERDKAGIVAVINANSMDVMGTQRALIDHQGRLRRVHYVPPDAESIVAVTADDQIIAYQHLAAEPPYILSEIGGAVHPAYRGRGIGTWLLRWAEQRATDRLPLAPAAAQVLLYCNIFDFDHRAQVLLLAEGYRQARQWIHLMVELQEPPPSPVWPAGITVRQLDRRHDWPLAGPALTEAFADHWGVLNYHEEEAETPEAGEEEAGEAVDDPYFNSAGLCFVAWHGNDVAGLCLCNAQTIEWPEAGKVGSLSVRRPYRRQGLGQALLYQAFGEFYRRGVRRIITDTDAQNFTGANRLYQRAGMRIFRRENLYQKIIRPGQELRTLSVDEI